MCVCVSILQRPPAAPTKTLSCTMTPPLTIMVQPRAHGCSREPGLSPPPVLFLSQQIDCLFHLLLTPPHSPFQATLQRLTAEALQMPSNQLNPAPKGTWNSSVSQETTGGARASSLHPCLSWPSFQSFLPAAAAMSAVSVWTVTKSS